MVSRAEAEVRAVYLDLKTYACIKFVQNVTIFIIMLK